MTYFFLWKSEKRQRMSNYDCDTCIQHGLFEGRACFKDDYPGNDSYIFNLPIFDEDTPYPVGERREILDEARVLEELDYVLDKYPDMPPFEALQTYFRNPHEVCPTALVGLDLAHLIEAEQATREYHTLPFDGGLWDQPQVLLEIFSLIRTERNQYERIRIAKLSKQTDKDTPSRKLPKLRGHTNMNPGQPGQG